MRTTYAVDSFSQAGVCAGLNSAIGNFSMIPREILNTIRQIEQRANRLGSDFAAGARASARFTDRKAAASKTNPALYSIRTLKRRERRAPAAPGRGCVRSALKSAIANRQSAISP
jgi:hypothetical protein